MKVIMFHHCCFHIYLCGCSMSTWFRFNRWSWQLLQRWNWPSLMVRSSKDLQVVT